MRVRINTDSHTHAGRHLGRGEMIEVSAAVAERLISAGIAAVDEDFEDLGAAEIDSED